ncbi:SRPBCC family protein [Virgibacillus sp. YIM 98842]|uniref:SRPBCC family protein n=1 Tax=Virgibacillus sp. YIM 98842 TaxID=2663533 RepID=UPI0013DAB69B|nr:SRPBCC family protein [Virgibacillus sp. YIM 98842]
MSLHFEVKQTIQVPKEEVFESILDSNAAHHWKQGIVRIERLDDGPIKPGSELKETRKVFNKEAYEHFEVVELSEPEKVVLRCDGTKSTTGQGEYIITYQITSSGEVSRIILNGEIKGVTGLSKLFGKLTAGSFKKTYEKDLEALKDYLEN